MNTNCTTRLLIIGALLSSLALGAGCRKKVPYEVPDAAPAAAVPSPAPPPPVQKASYHVVEGVHDDPRNQPAISQVSILKPQMAVASLVSLTVGNPF